jgi:hypothetical protein
MEGDPTFRWQTMRVLFEMPDVEWQEEREFVAEAGWGARLLSMEDPRGTWGSGLYSSESISTTYTSLQLRDMGHPRTQPAAQQATRLLIDKGLVQEGTLGYRVRLARMDLCIMGVFLGLYFGITDSRIEAMAAHQLEN